jgi:PKD repeat protein
MNTSTANVVTVNALPMATSTAAGVTTFCQGGNVVLNANTGTGLTYQWQKNGAVIPMATNPSYTANTSGAYTIVVTDGNNCMNSASTNVTVNPLPNTNISYVTPTTFCQGGNVVLSVPHVPNALYEWSRNGVTIPNAEMAHYVATTSGNYSVEVLDVNLCYSESAATAVTVNTNPSPVITVNGNTNFCEGDSVQLTASGGLTYLWSTTSTNAAIWLRAGGFYTVTVSNGNCSATAAQQVSPRAVPPASIAAIGPLTFCRGSNVTLNANTGTGLTYQWQKNGSPVLGSTNSTFVTDTTGSYRVIVTGTNGCTTTTSALTVTSNPNPMARLTPSAPVTLCQGDSARFSISGGTTYLWSNNRTDTAFWVKTGGAYAVTVTDANGCTAYAANSLTINALPMATITAGGVTSVCPDDVVSLNAPVGAGYMYQWRRNGNAIGTSRVFNATTAGAYTVSVTDANGCKANSDTTKVIYFNRPTVGFTNSLQSGTGSVMNFTNTSSAGTVRWYFGDALNSTSTQTNPSFTYRSNGTYSVRLVVTNANGCSDSTAASVMITGARTGVNDLVEPLRINVFPNPFAESVQIEIENTTVNFGNNDKIMVTNALGQMVYQAVLNQKSMSVDTQNWSEGIYNVMIYSNGQMIPVKKVVKVVR